jgi:pyruvate dehydrogenase E1 component alpha subunit/2-oxoisovalerate dehydrogenase E1 component alpha subunit
VVNGALLARRFKGVTGTVGATCLGEGGTSTGAFHEAINQAAVERLPLVLAIANNQYAYSTPNSRQFACGDLLHKAKGYGVEGHSVDGTDLAACLKVVGEAVQRARKGQGPQLIVAKLLRLCGHGEHDDSAYIETRHKTGPHGRDCLSVARDQLLEQGWAGAETLEGWRNEATHKVEEAVATAQREPLPDPFKENWCALASKHLAEGYTES